MSRRPDSPHGDDAPPPHHRGHERAFRLLLRLLPRDLRQAHGDEMVELFRWRLERCRSAGLAAGRRATVRLWWSFAADLVATSVRERASPLRALFTSRPAAPGRPHRRLASRKEGPMPVLFHDLVTALRRLARTPLFTLAAIAIVALAIGVNTAAFTVVDAFLFRPLGYHEPRRLVHVYQDSDDGEPTSTSFPAYRDMAKHTEVFSGVAATSFTTLTWERPDGPHRATVELATASLFPVLGITPRHGRWFDRAEDHVGAGAYAVVSHRTWTREMGADPGVVGGTVQIEGQPVTLVGVGPEDYLGSGAPGVTDFWLSISSAPVAGPVRVANLERREDHWYQVIARLAAGVSRAEAQAAMDLLAARLAEEYPQLNRGRGITVFGTDQVRIHPDADAEVAPAGALAMVIVALVLLLACTNLANLLLVRGVARAREVAVRRALGASRSRIVGLFLGESLVIAVVGGALGLALAVWTVAALPALPLPFVAGVDLRIDGRVALFALGLVLVSAAIFGGLPALRMARAGVGALHGGRSAGPRGGALLRRSMVAIQVAVSMALLVGAALFARSLVRAAAVEPGVRSGSVAYLQASWSRRGLGAEELAVTVEEARARLAALPGVTGVALASRLPVHDIGGSTTTLIDGYRPPAGGSPSVELLLASVSPDYFETLGIELRAGRIFGPQDDQGDAPTAIVNETAARRFWGSSREAIGKLIRRESEPEVAIEVVGVVADSKVRRLTEPPTPLLYRSVGQLPLGSPIFLARTAGDPSALAVELRSALRRADPGVPIRAAGTLDAHLGDALDTPRALAAVLGGVAVAAMLLASLGIHAVVAFSVARRTSELGIRRALGARSGRIVGLVLTEALATVGIGLALGAVLADGVARMLEGLLFGVGRLDPASFALAGLALLLAAGAASYLPARRATAVDPVQALRVE